MKSIVEEITQKLGNQEFITLEELKNIVPQTSSGFYWIYTKLDISRFQQSSKPTNPAHVNFQELSTVHSKLNYIIEQKSRNYWCIYNGKGKQLRNRVVAEFSNTNGATGTLALTSCSAIPGAT